MRQLSNDPLDKPHAQSVDRMIRIKIRGLPEDVQQIADALEVALPGAMSWYGFAPLDESSLVEIKGVSHKHEGRPDHLLG